MKLEYLFENEENKEALSQYEYTPEKGKKTFENIDVKKNIKEINESSLWILSFTTKSENQDAAELFSYINEKIIEYNPKVLLNESAAYFNRKIYPLVNEFERKLRKYLYLKISIYNENKSDDLKITIEDKTDKESKNNKNSKDNKKKWVLNRLETMEFGDLYTKLFTDDTVLPTFNSRVSSRVSSKSYYQKILSEIPEKTIWDTIIGVNKNDFIKENFLTITDFRNDTMHAHNISYTDYLKQKNTFEKAIKFIGSEINKIISNPVTAEIAETTLNTLYDRIMNQKLDNITFKYQSPILNTDIWAKIFKMELEKYSKKFNNNFTNDKKFHEYLNNLYIYLYNVNENEKYFDDENNEDKK